MLTVERPDVEWSLKRGERFEVRRFDIDGKLQHTLVADKLLHYPDDDTTIVTTPHVTYHQLPPTDIFARMAYIGKDGKEVDLVATLGRRP